MVVRGLSVGGGLMYWEYVCGDDWNGKTARMPVIVDGQRIGWLYRSAAPWVDSAGNRQIAMSMGFVPEPKH